MQSILVTGGSGTLGRAVVRRLLDAGRDVRVLSRRSPDASQPDKVEWVIGDLRGRAGLDDAVRDVAAVIHCATDIRAPRRDVVGTRNLIEAARGGGAPHLVYISIVGVDRVPLPYYRLKFEVERLVENSGLPWTILRTTQFHNLIFSLWRLLARLPVMLVPALRFQPVDVGEVAARLVELAVAPPAGRVPDMGGPRVLTTAELARAYLRASGRRRLVLPVRLPGKVFRAYRRGGHLTPEHADGRRSYEEFLVDAVQRGRQS